MKEHEVDHVSLWTTLLDDHATVAYWGDSWEFGARRDVEIVVAYLPHEFEHPEILRVRVVLWLENADRTVRVPILLAEQDGDEPLADVLARTPVDTFDVIEAVAADVVGRRSVLADRLEALREDADDARRDAWRAHERP